MLKACRGAVLATGLLSLPLVAAAECPPVDSIDRYAQTAGDALSALHELVPEEQLRALEDRYAAMVMLKWQWQGRAAIRADAPALSQILSCYEQAECGVRASEQITVEIMEKLEQSGADPQMFENVIPPQPSDQSYAWARRTLECDGPQPAPIVTADLIVQEPADEPAALDTLTEPAQTTTPDLQVTSTQPSVSFEPVQPRATSLTTSAETAAPEISTPQQVASEQVAEVSVDPAPIERTNPEPQLASLAVADTERLMLDASNSVIAGKPSDAISPLESACLAEAAHTDKSAPCETLFAVYTNSLVASESTNSKQAYLDLSQSLCDLGYSRGCDNMSRYYAAQNAPEAHRAAVAYAEQSCNLANAEACATVASFYLAGRASEPDPAAARAKLEESCELGRLISCQEVADYYLRGIGGDPDPVMALRMVEASCPEGSTERADLCVSAADYILINERSGADRSARVRTFIRRACSIGHDVGCAWYAEDLELGIGGDVDLRAAREARLTACEYGDQESCNSRS